MTHSEFLNKELHNRHIEFTINGETFTGVILDILHQKKKTPTQGIFIPTENLIEWRQEETNGDSLKMERLSSIIDIDDIEWGQQLPMNKEHVILRIRDWEKRLDELYDNLKDWLVDTPYSIKIVKDQIMQEAFMKQFNVPERKLNFADIYYKTGLVMTFKPIGLWLIGANGRIDILTKKSNYILVDLASNFRQTDWNIYLSNKNKKVKFNKTVFFKLLSNEHN